MLAMAIVITLLQSSADFVKALPDEAVTLHVAQNGQCPLLGD
jgi:hypothetical protein